MLGSLLIDEHEMIARSQKRFAGDTADVQASAAKFFVFFNEGNFQA